MSLDLTKLKGTVPEGIFTILPEALSRYEVNTPLRAAHFLSQLHHESGGFKSKTESLFYSKAQRIVDIWPTRFNLTGANGKRNANEYTRNEEKLAAAVYDGRMGNDHPGDGFRFRGGGFLQLTGKDAYKGYAAYIQKDVGEAADLIRNSDYHALDSALWIYCIDKNINPIADRGEDVEVIKSVTKRINGGLIGISERTSLFRKFKSLIR